MIGTSRRLAAVLAAVVLAFTACGGGTAEEEPLASEATAEATVEATPVPEAPAEPEEEEEEPAPTEEALPEPDPANEFETTVVTATPAVVGQIEMFDGPDGSPITFYEPVTNPTYFGTDLAMVVTEGAEGDEWIKVQLPVRPNGTEGWIRAEGWVFDTHEYRAEVNVSANTVTVWEGEEVVAQTGAVDGKPSTPTPLGTFFINDKVPGGNGAYGPWILSLSAYSEALETFDGGLPVIAIHGTNQPELIGTDSSNGCVRIPNDVIQLLADTVPLGTPVEITS